MHGFLVDGHIIYGNFNEIEYFCDAKVAEIWQDLKTISVILSTVLLDV